ncbi:baseplate J/gp47 family protein [Permianibacter aggregans]|uniref:Baseplate J-like protein n=1 Tax=Permianibacter aggregans TaxID=1510150 RepID=A0A4R6UWW5_9GAMM|nr:baseplate J/gp47 family protein [Permianibacter aggregans]QGX41011.1 hypothetical protein E2H98_15595 [Permianibacter aggregans]TDQ48074.1 baseplate J-like protein [Permianibacter aggregans]
MSTQALLQQQSLAPGQSQAERVPAELDENYPVIDDRQIAELYQFLRDFSTHVKFFDNDPAAHWQSFFPPYLSTIHASLQARDGTLPPHLALVLAYLKLYRHPQALLNALNKRHMDFQYRDVLHFSPLAANPDEAFLALTLKPNASSTLVEPGHFFSAGKDASGIERRYAPTESTVITAARIEQLKCLWRDTSGRGALRVSPIANSADGLGAELPEHDVQWSAFGAVSRPLANVGFAVASPLLFMVSSERSVTLKLRIDSANAASLSSARWGAGLHCYLTGSKNWIGPLGYQCTRSGNELHLKITVPESAGDIVAHNSAVHGSGYPNTEPVLQIVLNQQQTQLGWNDVKSVQLQQLQLQVSANGVLPQTMANDFGDLKPDKAFHPWGPQPKSQMVWRIGHDEMLAKPLSKLDITVEWQNPPSNFASHYANYNLYGISNSSFNASIAYRDAGGAQRSSTINLFNNSGAATVTWQLGAAGSPTQSSPAFAVYQLHHSGSLWAKTLASQFVLHTPVLHGADKTPVLSSADKRIHITLLDSFYHEQYRKRTIEEAYKTTGKQVLNEPYTPVIRSVSMDYVATGSWINLNAQDATQFANEKEKFFHVDAFGVRREHGVLRQALSYVAQKSVPLFAEHNAEGELYLGVAALAARQSISVYFEVAQGTANPDKHRTSLRWQVLCDNHWRDLNDKDGLQDGTDALTHSGIVTAVMPPEITSGNSLMPEALVWLRVSAAQDADAVCALRMVVNNGIKVRFQDPGNAPQHYLQALPSKSINKLITPIEGIKTLAQPYPSFSGRAAESDADLYRRAHERLRHKDRAVTSWDMERLVLQHFPQIHRVKVLQHSAAQQWLQPGSVLVLVLPNQQQTGGVDALNPRADIATLEQIKAMLQTRLAMGALVEVRNPRFQRVRLQCQVKMRAGYAFDYYAGVLQQQLIAYLSPWAYDQTQTPHFGGRLYRSALINLLEEHPSVDYLTDVKLQTWLDTPNSLTESHEVSPLAPDVILASDYQHALTERL